MHARTVTLLLSTMLLAAACGDDGGAAEAGESARPYVDAFLAQADETDRELIGEANLECFATSYVETIGPDVLEGAGVTPAELVEAEGPAELGVEATGADADEFVDRLEGCMDITDYVVGDVANYRERELGPAAEECVRDALDEEMLRDSLRAFYLGEPYDSPVLVAERECPAPG